MIDSDLKRTTLANYETNVTRPDLEMLLKISKFYGVTVDNILAGELEPNNTPLPQNGAVIPVDLGDTFIMNVPLVPIPAYAGYLSKYDAPDYIEDLPKIPWIVDKEHKGRYLTFEVKNDSMSDGTNESYLQGDYILVREIPRQYWRDKLHYKKWDFVVHVRGENVLLKKIIAHDTKEGKILLHSLNPEYSDTWVNLDDVAQLFNVVRVMRKKQ